MVNEHCVVRYDNEKGKGDHKHVGTHESSYRFIDMETGEELKINPADIREEYIKNICKYTGDLKLKCSQFGIDYVEADINMGFFQVLYAYLIKRQSLI